MQEGIVAMLLPQSKLDHQIIGIPHGLVKRPMLEHSELIAKLIANISLLGLVGLTIALEHICPEYVGDVVHHFLGDLLVDVHGGQPHHRVPEIAVVDLVHVPDHLVGAVARRHSEELAAVVAVDLLLYLVAHLADLLLVDSFVFPFRGDVVVFLLDFLLFQVIAFEVVLIELVVLLPLFAGGVIF